MTEPPDFRAHPDQYRVARGEIGVFHSPPYTEELSPLWKFATPDAARASSAALWHKFEAFRAQGDFVGMDVARKFIQMGYTRARRYANHKGGRKYGADGAILPLDPDPQKAECAAVFKQFWDAVRADPTYQRLKAEHQARHEKA